MGPHSRMHGEYGNHVAFTAGLSPRISARLEMKFRTSTLMQKRVVHYLKKQNKNRSGGLKNKKKNIPSCETDAIQALLLLRCSSPMMSCWGCSVMWPINVTSSAGSTKAAKALEWQWLNRWVMKFSILTPPDPQIHFFLNIRQPLWARLQSNLDARFFLNAFHYITLIIIVFIFR